MQQDLGKLSKLCQTHIRFNLEPTVSLYDVQPTAVLPRGIAIAGSHSYSTLQVVIGPNPSKEATHRLHCLVENLQEAGRGGLGKSVHRFQFSDADRIARPAGRPFRGIVRNQFWFERRLRDYLLSRLRRKRGIFEEARHRFANSDLARATRPATSTKP